MNIIGLSAYYHESACCLLRDGKLVTAVAEERLTRIKHDGRLPVRAFRHCLQAGGISITDVDCIAYYESPEKKLARQIWAGNPSYAPPGLRWLDAVRPEREIRELLGYEGRIEMFEHHASHAASTFLYSGFDEAAVLTVDGVGEWATTTYGAGRGGNIDLFEEVHFPHSIGLLYSAITGYLGFRVMSGEYKVMGLAPYGQPTYVDRIRQLIDVLPGGQYRLRIEYFDFVRGSRMFSDKLAELMGAPPRVPESELTQFHKDVARSIQVVLEEFLLDKVRYIRERVPSDNLCLAGGVALNCVANGRIVREGPFKRLFVQPAPGDAGGCLGAAALAHVKLTGKRHSFEPLHHDYLGPRYSNDDIAALLGSLGIQAVDMRGNEPGLLEAVVDRIVDGKVVGWLQGAMEFGPRSLGARSLLADPRRPNMREHLNRAIKKREGFRPFAPSVLLERASEHFMLDHASPYMLEVCQVTSKLVLPAITHVDGSARPQTVDRKQAPRYAALIDAFERRTGCPILVNTSFNVRGEPVVCSPEDAIRCMLNSDIDTVILEDFLIDRAMLPEALHEMARIYTASVEERRVAFSRRSSTAGVYSFT